MKPMRPMTTGLLLAAAIALPALADDPADVPATPAPMDVERAHDSAWSYLQEKYDADGDGSVTPEEYRRSAEAFARLDRDGDGILDEQDFGARIQRPRGQRGEPRQRPRGTPEGEPAPDFTLRPLHLDPELEIEEQLVTLSSFEDDRPVALIFGSYT